MKPAANLKVDVAHSGFVSPVEAMQGDGGLRSISVELTDGGKPWYPPAGTEIAVAYTHSNGTKGLYNKLPDGRKAVTLRNNIVTVVLAPQMLAAVGEVKAAIVFSNEKLDQLTTFPITITVKKNLFADAQETVDYIRLQWLEDKLDAYLKKAKDSGVFDGPKGEPFTYADFTPEQLAALTGPQGPAGDNTAALEAAAAANEAAIQAKEATVAAQAVVGTVMHDVTQIKAFFTEYKSQMSDTTASTQYIQISEVEKYDGYAWTQYGGHISNIRIETANRTAIEFDVAPNTEYLVQGMNAGISLNYGIGFFPDSSTHYSSSEIVNAIQETVEDVGARCTRFITPNDCTHVRMTVYQNASYDKQLKKEVSYSYTVKDDAISSNIQRSMDDGLLTDDKSIVGAINEIKQSSVGTAATVPWLLSPAGDSTDRSGDIAACLAAYGICQLKKGDYYVSVKGITMPDHTKLVGTGSGTRIILQGYDSTVGQCVTLGKQCTVSDIMFVGNSDGVDISLAPAIIERHGVLWYGNASTAGTSDPSIPVMSVIQNCHFTNFKGSGICCKDTGSGPNNGISVSNCFMTHCRCGLYIPFWSEFNRFTNVHVTTCYYGCINNGGNNMFVNCNFTKNTIGFLMDNTDADKTNNSHGSAVGCIFDHSGNNAGIGIKVINMHNGFVFSSCQLFYSKIDITNASGIVFDHMNCGRSEGIAVDGGGAVLFDGCMFGSDPEISVTDNSYVHFKNCYVRSTGAVVSN